MNASGSADVAQGDFGFANGYRSVGGLYHFGQRYYDPATMRWTQPDPLDQTGDLSEGNRYVYVGADPVNLTDPFGLWGRGSVAGCEWGPVSVTGSRDDEGETSLNIGLGLGVGGGCYGNRYAESTGSGVSGGFGGCLVVCGGLNSDSGTQRGVGVDVSFSAGIEVNIGL